MALVVAVNQLFDLAKVGMLSASGHYNVWYSSANGYLHGKGCGAIVLEVFNQ